MGEKKRTWAYWLKQAVSGALKIVLIFIFFSIKIKILSIGSANMKFLIFIAECSTQQ